jgi:hypothetical protein
LKPKNLLVLAIIAMVLFWMIRDPVSAGQGARHGITLVLNALQAIAVALGTFLKGLFH